MPSRLQMKENDHLAELDALLASTSRQPLKERLQGCRDHIEGLLTASLKSPASLKQGLRDPSAAELPKQDTPTQPQEGPDATPTVYEAIDTYVWIQSSKFLKLDLTVPGLTADDHDKVTCTFTDRGVNLRLDYIEGNFFSFVEEHLSHKVKPKLCKFKVQEGSVLLFLAKADPSLSWGIVSTSSHRQGTVPDHYGRTELKLFLNEYYRIKASHVFQTPEYPLEESIRELMTSRGYYDVFDVASARTALTSFAQSPPKAAVVDFSLVEKSKATKKLLTELLTVLAAAPDCKLMFTCQSFIRPEEHMIYSHHLDLIIKGSCELTHFSGRINCSLIDRLPSTLYKLGVGIRDAKDAAMVAKMTLPKSVHTFGVCVSRTVDAKDLKPLPKVKHPIQLFFYGTTVKDIEWVLTCVINLMGSRTCWLNFPHCQLPPRYIGGLIRGFFELSCPITHRYKFYAELANNGLPLHLIPPAFQNPQTEMTVPVLGQPPCWPKLPVCGVVGAAFDSPHLSPEGKQSAQRAIRIFGCQLKWAVEWTDAE